MSEVTVKRDLCMLMRSVDDQSKLCRLWQLLPAGTIIEVIDKHEISYNDEKMRLLRIDYDGDERFILEDDLSMENMPMQV